MKQITLFVLVSVTLTKFCFANIDKDCLELAKRITSVDKNFPDIAGKDIESLVTWRVSQCASPPKGDGDVVRLCEAVINSNNIVFYWQKKNRRSDLINGFITCRKDGSSPSPKPKK